MPLASITILAALRTEELALRKALLDFPEVSIVRIGLRGARMDRVRAEPGSVVLLAGVGGGCHPDLRTGEVIVDPWPNGFVSSTARAGRIVCSEVLLRTPESKRDFRRRTEADVVDMESDAAQSFVDQLGAKLIHIRAILDVADDVLPDGIDRWVDEDGRTRAGAVAGALLRRPWQVPELARLGRRSSAALDRLGVVVRELVGSFRSVRHREQHLGAGGLSGEDIRSL